MKGLAVFSVAIALFAFVLPAEAQIPSTLSYQGVLTDTLGNPRPDGIVSFTFRLYETPTGGTAIWTETKNLQLRRGLFFTALGDVTPFGAGVRFDRPYWLAIQPGGEPELSPRIALTSVGYSFSAIRSDTAQFALTAPQQTYVDSARIASTVPNNSVTSAKILDGTIQRVDVASTFKAPYADTADAARTSAPSGNAGGDLTGTYPNPSIATNAVTSAKILDGTIQRVDVASTFKAPYADTADAARTSAPSGNAGGDLAGTYPNPSIATNAVTSAKILDGTIQRVDVASTFKAPYADTADAARTSAPSGNAGGDLAGTYPNPSIATNAVTSAKILDGTIQRVDVASTFKAPAADTADYARASVPGGTAGGDLTGTYPNPTIATNAVTSAKIADNAVTSAKIADGTVATADVADGAITMAKINQSGATAGQVIKWTGTAWAPRSDSSGGPPSGTAGGDLTGTYPNPSIGNNMVTTAKIADAAVSSAKLADNAVTSAKILDGTIQRVDVASTFKAPAADTADYALAAALGGSAGGDLSGTYPNPTVARLQTRPVSSSAPSSGDVLKWSGSTWAPAADAVGSLTLPFSGSANAGAHDAAVFQVTNTATSGANYSGYFRSNSTGGYGVLGYATAASGATYGVYGQSNSTSGYGVVGYASATSGENYGVRGQSDGTSGLGVYGVATAASGTTYGVYGRSNSTGGRGVYGLATAATGLTYGGYFESSAFSGRGVFGLATDGSGTNIGGYFESRGTSGRGVYGLAAATTGSNAGVAGVSESSSGTGVSGLAMATSGSNFGGRFQSNSPTGYGVYGLAAATGGLNYGVMGHTESPFGYGVFCSGNLGATGIKAFQIDHPLRPETHYLSHFCTEGPEPMNAYSGNVVTDANGYATITLPNYFESINRDFRYQLTVVDDADQDFFVLAKVVREIRNNQFTIRTSAPFVEVSWEVKAIRNDRYVQQYGFQAVQEKEAEIKGKYVQPELYGLPKERGVHYRPEMEHLGSTPQDTQTPPRDSE